MQTESLHCPLRGIDLQCGWLIKIAFISQISLYFTRLQFSVFPIENRLNNMKITTNTKHNSISVHSIVQTSNFSFLFTEYSENTHQQGKLRKYRKQRIVFEPTQLKVLEDMFAFNAYPCSKKFEHISKLTMIDEARLRIWFQNRRARCRKMAKNTNL